MSSIRRRWLALLELGRVSNLPTVWSNVTVAAFLGGPDRLTPFLWIMLFAAGTLLYVGGTTLNDFFDAAFDRLHRRERPIPQGIWSRTAVGILGFGELTAGTLLMLWAGSHWPWLLGLLAAILVYDGIHKRWAGSVLFMGACRGFLVLAVLSAASPASSIDTSAWIYAASLFLYIVGITLTARAESGPESDAEPLHRWPWLLLLAPVVGFLVSLPHTPEHGGSLLAAVALAVVLAMLFRALRLLGERRNEARIGRCVSLLLAGIVLIDGLFLGAVAGWFPWVAMLLLYALARIWQKRVAAT